MPEVAPPFWKDFWEVRDDGSLRQGDVFTDLAVAWLADDFDAPGQAERVRLATGGTWILTTPSCDLEQDRVQRALLCRVAAVTAELMRAETEKVLAKRLEVVRQGLDPSKFLLPEHGEEPHFPRSIAFIREQVLVPIAYLLRNTGGARLRMKHPWREKFGNWVGQRFSEVGPEVPVPRISSIYAQHILDANNPG